MGSNKDTIKFEYNGITFIKFKATDLIQEFEVLKERNNLLDITVVGRPNLNEWMGRKTPQLFVEDYEIKEIENNF